MQILLISFFLLVQANLKGNIFAQLFLKCVTFFLYIEFGDYEDLFNFNKVFFLEFLVTETMFVWLRL